MNIKEYLLSKVPYIVINLIIYLLVLVLMKIAETPNIILFLIFIIWFCPLIIYIIIDFFQKLNFYNDINKVLDKLDKKYLLPEIIKKPNFYDGKLVYDVLQESNRNMHEHVNFYKNLQKEYREYVEVWVHEIKTPIASSKLILENMNLKEKILIDDEIRKIDDYINQALYYSRSTDVNNDYIVKEFLLKEAVQESIRTNRRDFISKKISVDIEGVYGKAITDVKWVKFIINQIIINSIKYSKDSGAILKVYTIEGDNNILLTIEDNGVGIPSKDINRVFDKGFTGENGRKYGKSTGIGLYLCKKLCGKLGLGIDLTSMEGEGTKVKLIFPYGDFMSIDN